MRLELPHREQNSNKGTFGKVINLSGSKNYIGAPYLSTLAVLKIGAGYVSLAGSAKIIDSVSKMLPEAVFMSEYEGYKALDKYNVLLIGCGIGQGFWAKYWFKKYIKKAEKLNISTIIDADGLNILAKTKIKLPKNTIITPHPAEASRLMGAGINDILNDLETSAEKLSEKYNCITVLKTHRTLIYAPNGNIYENEHGNSALAKAGSGDVLAGITAGLLAQKMNAFDSAKLAVYLHSRAGEIASETLTEYSVLPSDIIKYLPKAVAELV